MVEIYAQTPDGTDWDFCIDNIMVKFGHTADEENPKDNMVPLHMHVLIDIVWRCGWCSDKSPSVS
jgi:hypothetical protein